MGSDAVVNLDSDCYALRDIQLGEEMLENYSHFIGFHELVWFDRIRGNAWKEPELQHKKGMNGDLLAKSSETYNIFGAPKKGWDGSYSQQHHHGRYALLGAICLVGVGVCVVKKFPYYFFQKEKR